MLARTIGALGPINVARVLRYRLSLKFAQLPALGAKLPSGPFFRPVGCDSDATALSVPSGWDDGVLLFGRHRIATSGDAPDFLSDPFGGGGGARATATAPWWNIPDFADETGDIKAIWELFRFSWVPAFAQQARAGDATAIGRPNRWIVAWCAQNPPSLGPNWKCGQETSVRIMHLLAAAMLLDQAKDPADDLVELIALHASRIASTIGYAIAQDNNHGTSEAAALFLAGSWPALRHDPRAGRWRETGRKWLENRVARLIGADGTFSLYSTNYHRVLLDTLSLVEIWRRTFQLAPFSPTFHNQARQATEWLRALTDPDTGDVPNTGNNDGARLATVTDAPFRDYRPGIQLTAALFMDRSAFGDGPWNDQLRWLGVVPPTEQLPPPTDRIASDGGFAALRRGEAAVLMRFPRYRFRPAQADALHVDLTVSGENWLRDGGSFSYSIDPDLLDYFSGVRSHNTVQFDGHDQMPRIGRFLFGDWSRSKVLPVAGTPDTARFGARYRDWTGARHQRTVALSARHLEVVDDIDGFRERAVLRWRLTPRVWRQTADGVTTDGMTMTIESDQPIARMAIVDGLESRHYFEKTPLPVLEVELHTPGRIVSRLNW